MSLTDLFDEPQHLNGPDAQRCSAADRPEAWADLTVGWSRVLAAARTIQARHAEDTHDAVLSQCCDAAREAAVGELRWVWARLVHEYVEGVGADV
ncbi:hypothetical protein [Mycobacteroides abscessus]|uniref:hypothetical protein n=1 Tax=Mycobacteroides abscessus TaxID=36809 RepID=UPI0009295B31|nr:hypothetical protein [Mycobacteroides abscessus]SHO82326.1 Uncharacterised protein [Mycobacteroides abscessus subsp. abscessus]SHP25100.1 Uncharacterised protein [Mycobacteroides abscessus subsp. abscessus]SHP73039.1 Uncharacterised protein [Mycobacteroides abscessus subsp. abscessus]SHQ91624.1 Uncharacterised protein [Mycobacteroides abscessus subsp. abscessus]SHR00776.1 Uncharacterised protein [Mycobacteroides abscessus subsp. abscessus]